MNDSDAAGSTNAGATDSKLIDDLGGTTEVARLCRVKPPSVSEWRRNGIPDARRQFLQLLRPDIFRGVPAANDEVAETGGDEVTHVDH